MNPQEAARDMYADALRFMYVAWCRYSRAWPVWLQDEWEGEAGFVVMTCWADYDETRCAPRTWLFLQCKRRVAWWQRRLGGRWKVPPPREVLMDPYGMQSVRCVTDGIDAAARVEAEEAWRWAEKIDRETRDDRYVRDQKLSGGAFNGRHRRLLDRLREVYRDAID